MTRLQRKMLMKVAVGSGVLFLLGVVALFPKYNERNRLRLAVKELSGDSQQTRKMIETSYRFGERLEDILNQLEYYRNAVPSREALPEILDEIASKAQESQLQIISLQPMGEKAVENSGDQFLDPSNQEIQELLFLIKGRGTYLQFAGYLAQLENARYAILVKEVHLRNQQLNTAPAEREPVLDIEIKLAFLMKQASPGAEAAPKT